MLAQRHHFSRRNSGSRSHDAVEESRPPIKSVALDKIDLNSQHFAQTQLRPFRERRTGPHEVRIRFCHRSEQLARLPPFLRAHPQHKRQRTSDHEGQKRHSKPERESAHSFSGRFEITVSIYPRPRISANNS